MTLEESPFNVLGTEVRRILLCPMEREIPQDVMYHIVQFLAPNDQLGLYQVNSTFFKLGMKARYDTVSFEESGHDMKKLCIHLSEDNFRRFVRRVIIRPWLVQPRTKSCRSLSENAWNRFSRLIDPDYMRRQAKERVQKRLNKDVKRINNAVSGMDNITVYEILWDERRSYHREFYKAFMAPLITTWVNLEKLTLKVPHEMLGSLTQTSLPSLQNLEILLCTGLLHIKEINNAFDAFLVFVHNLRDTLRSLSIQATTTSEFLDLSYFFKHLGTFPLLQKFHFSIPFDGTQLPCTTILKDWLDRHNASLEHLALGTTRCSAGSAHHNPECINWIRSIIGDIHVPFPKLRSVELALRPLRADLNPLLSFLASHSTRMESLTLTDRELTFGEIEHLFRYSGMLDPGQSPLKHLRLRIRYLHPRLLAFLAFYFPRLNTLALDFKEVFPNELARHFPERSEQVDRFIDEILKDKERYVGWKLRSLGIQEGPNGCLWFKKLETLFMECIPALSGVIELPRLVS